VDLEPEEESRSSQLNPLWHLPHENCEFCHTSLSLDEACGATKWIAPERRLSNPPLHVRLL